MTKLELIKENAKLKYGITQVIDSISNIREFIDLKRYLIDLVDGNKTILNTDFYLYLLEKENQNKKLQHQLEEKDKIIDEAIKFVKKNAHVCYSNKENDISIIGHCMWHTDKLLEKLERGKNGK